MFEQAICAIFGHRHVVEKVISPYWRKVGCTRCRRQWGMHDPTRSFLLWDAEQEAPARTNHPAAFGIGELDAGRVRRLQDAIEGECDGLAIADGHARAILQYVDGGVIPGALQ